MKLRTDFVTNSSSSNFVVNLTNAKVASEEDMIKAFHFSGESSCIISKHLEDMINNANTDKWGNTYDAVGKELKEWNVYRHYSALDRSIDLVNIIRKMRNGDKYTILYSPNPIYDSKVD